MADFPELGQKYTSLEDDYDNRASFAMKVILLVIVLVLCVVTALNTLNIASIKQENDLLHIELAQKSKEISNLKRENEEQEQKLRIHSTDIRILNAIAEGIDPYNIEEE